MASADRRQPNNPLVTLIRTGKVNYLHELRGVYRRLGMKTHPDATGNAASAQWLLEISDYYEEAKLLFGPDADPAQVHRLHYYRTLRRLEQIDSPGSFHRIENKHAILSLNSEARNHFAKWRAGYEELYQQADNDYDSIKEEKPTDLPVINAPLVRGELAFTVSPIFYNITAFHLTALRFYRRQVGQNLNAILQMLTDRNLPALRDFRPVCSAGGATFRAVPSMKAMLEARIVETRTHGPRFDRRACAIWWKILARRFYGQRKTVPGARDRSGPVHMSYFGSLFFSSFHPLFDCFFHLCVEVRTTEAQGIEISL